MFNLYYVLSLYSSFNLNKITKYIINNNIMKCKLTYKIIILSQIIDVFQHWLKTRIENPHLLAISTLDVQIIQKHTPADTGAGSRHITRRMVIKLYSMCLQQKDNYTYTTTHRSEHPWGYIMLHMCTKKNPDLYCL